MPSRMAVQTSGRSTGSSDASASENATTAAVAASRAGCRRLSEPATWFGHQRRAVPDGHLGGFVGRPVVDHDRPVSRWERAATASRARPPRRVRAGSRRPITGGRIGGAARREPCCSPRRVQRASGARARRPVGLPSHQRRDPVVVGKSSGGEGEERDEGQPDPFDLALRHSRQVGDRDAGERSDHEEPFPTPGETSEPGREQQDRSRSRAQPDRRRGSSRRVVPERRRRRRRHGSPGTRRPSRSRRAPGRAAAPWPRQVPSERHCGDGATGPTRRPLRRARSTAAPRS